MEKTNTHLLDGYRNYPNLHILLVVDKIDPAFYHTLICEPDEGWPSVAALLSAIKSKFFDPSSYSHITSKIRMMKYRSDIPTHVEEFIVLCDQIPSIILSDCTKWEMFLGTL